MTALAIGSSKKLMKRTENTRSEDDILEFLRRLDIDNWDIKPKAYQLNRS